MPINAHLAVKGRDGIARESALVTEVFTLIDHLYYTGVFTAKQTEGFAKRLTSVKTVAGLKKLAKDVKAMEDAVLYRNPRRRNGTLGLTATVMEAALVNAKKAVTLLDKADVDLDLFQAAAAARTALNKMVLTRRRLKRTGTGFSINVAAYNEIVAVFHAVAHRLPANSKARLLLLDIPVAVAMNRRRNPAAKAGLVGPTYFPATAKVRLGEQVYVDEGDAFKVTGLAAGSDPHNEQYAAELVASGIFDDRNHRGDWAVIERRRPPHRLGLPSGSDAAIVSVGKGLKRNPRRRAARRVTRRR